MNEMKFNEIAPENQERIKKQIVRVIKDQDIDYNQVVVTPESTNENLVIRYKDWTINIPIQGPDKPTTNTIWTILATGVVAIGAVAVTLALGNSKK